VVEFQDRFASKKDCSRYLVACRQPDGFLCPRCGRLDTYELPLTARHALTTTYQMLYAAEPTG
jgi:hypothetical protein